MGARDLDPGERDYIAQTQLAHFSAGITDGDALVDFAKTAGYSNVYIHFDLDVLEPADFPHVLVATPQGLRFESAIRAVALLREQLDVVGASVVEYCPIEGGGTEALRRLVVEGFGRGCFRGCGRDA